MVKRLLVLMTLALLALILVRLVAKPRPSPPAEASIDAGTEPEGLIAQPIHSLRNEDIGSGKRFWVRNSLAGPIEVDCRLEDERNVQSDPALPRRMVLPARAERELTALRSLDATQDSSAAVSCTAVVGRPDAVADSAAIYALPFYPGTDFTLEQGYGGAFSHHDPDSRYAIDLGVAEGTPVLAARDGAVMQLEQDFRGNGTDLQRDGARANFVRILHDDGSMALYAHLAPESTLVRMGDRVRTGDFLGKSGNTGYSTGPHLHFAVQVNDGMQLRSLPMTMTGVDLPASR